MGRGVLPAGHRLLVTRARSTAFTEADLLIVVGTPLDFRLGYGTFGSARVVHVADTARGVSTHVELAGAAAGDLTTCLDGIRAGWESLLRRPRYDEWSARLGDVARAATDRDRDLLASDADPIHPARIYGELLPRLAADAVVIGDGGDFVSFAGRFVEPRVPGGWLDPGPYGCLGTGLGYAIAARLARPPSQVVALLGDGAAGFSLMDVDTLVRHRLPVVMVMGNNGIWGLEKHPMQFLLPVRRGRRAATGDPLRPAGRGARGRRRAGHPPGRDRTCSRPGVRRRCPLPGERHHRPRGRLPPQHDRGVIARAAAQQIPLSRSYGFTWADSPPLFHHSKCRWLIPGLPVSPISAITSPAAKRSPARTRCLELCP